MAIFGPKTKKKLNILTIVKQEAGKTEMLADILELRLKFKALQHTNFINKTQWTIILNKWSAGS